MTREDEGHFARKHGPDARLEPAMQEKIHAKAKDGRMACAVAFQVAEELAVAPAEVGKALDLMEIKLIKCQLGLFGYPGGKKVLDPPPPEVPGLAKAVEASLVEGKLPCRSAWELARKFQVGKMAVAAACDGLGIKIQPCQLGAF